MTDLVKVCPRCRAERPVGEAICESELDEGPCGWLLTEQPVQLRGRAAVSTGVQSAPPEAKCPNGHRVEADDTLCLECGAEVGVDRVEEARDPTPSELSEGTNIGGWTLEGSLASKGGPWAQYVAVDHQGRRAIATIYEAGAEPDPAVHDVLRRMDTDHIPELIATGRWQDRAYEISELLQGTSLRESDFFYAADYDNIRRVIDEVSRALDGFGELGLRHRDITPDTIRVRSVEPLDLVITGFGSARLSDFDLDAVAPLELTRYSAPEAIVGGVSVASDWWSLGTIILEHITRGACFEGVNDKAFQIHVVTRGISLPTEIDPDFRVLLRGLLARDPLKRWRGAQVRAWLAGASVDAPPETSAVGDDASGPAISLGGRKFTRPAIYALAAAEGQNWELSKGNLLRGALATWLEDRGVEGTDIAAVRRLAADEELSDDFRHALTLMVLNPSLPLTLNGEIVTPAWLLGHPQEGYEIVVGAVTRHLEWMGREPWLVRFRGRAQSVRERAKSLEIALDEDRLRIALLASSRINLDAERSALRKVYPDSDHQGLASLIDHDRLSDEDLIILITAIPEQFQPLSLILDEAEKLAERSSVATFDRSRAADILTQARRDIYREVSARTEGFAVTENPRANEWADSFRIERRISLPRAAVLLALSPEAWVQPPRQQYLSDLLGHFEKRVVRSVQRGPLVRFMVGKTTARVDFLELGSSLRPAEALLDELLRRSDSPLLVDPAAVAAHVGILQRLRRLTSHALTFKRDTAIDGRYLAYPFLLVRDSRLVSKDTKPRIAPVLLWPITLDVTSGLSPTVTIGFDRDREEVRLNPALEGLLEPNELARWEEARHEILARPTIRTPDVMDVFGALATPLGRSLTTLPGKDSKLGQGSRALSCSAALFNAEFTGQAVAEDLRSLRRMSPDRTSLEVALRVREAQGESAPTAPVTLLPQDQYLTVESDPSQESAVVKARSAPGLLIEGPPGTGKSQTIVNILADCIGHGQTALVVCQKQAALRVVQKRLEAEGLGERIFLVVDPAKDREGIVRQLRDQLARIRTGGLEQTAAQRAERAAVAARMTSGEAELNRHHDSLYRVDEATGLTYRAVLSQLIGQDSEGVIEVPTIRAMLSGLRRDDVARLEETCAPLAHVWLDSEYESNPLHVLAPASSDEGAVRELSRCFDLFAAAERSRKQLLEGRLFSIEFDDHRPIDEWLRGVGTRLATLPADVGANAKKWFEDLNTGAAVQAAAETAIGALETAVESLRNIDGGESGLAMNSLVETFSAKELNRWTPVAANAVREVGVLGRFSLARWLSRRRYRQFLKEHSIDATERAMEEMAHALSLELHLRPIRSSVLGAASLMGSTTNLPMTTIQQVRDITTRLLSDIRPIREAAIAVTACPCSEAAETMMVSGAPASFAPFRKAVDEGLAMLGARRASFAGLEAIRPWFTELWTLERASEIRKGEYSGSVEEIASAMPTLRPFLRFRSRARELDSIALEVFAALRAHEEPLRAVGTGDLEDLVRRILVRESLHGWKERLESSNPELSLTPEELERKVNNLADAQAKLRDLNSHLLADDIDPTKLGTNSAWESITRIRGPRSRRLREVIDVGRELGLMHMRPIWLMTPDTASRVLPLKAGLFDVVIFDEASQLQVEHATPALFRAKRAVVSGDDKQMPPTSFFSSRGADEDDENDFDGRDLDESASDSEREIYEDTWNRREIVDCPDLLALSGSCLPSTTLQIHYRSKYRELIAYSNAAFYHGSLSVPARHPDSEVRRVQPIQVVFSEGVYDAQTNRIEAASVVKVLGEIWLSGESDCPSVGVVTFNRKQADLVEELIEERAAVDEAFLTAYRRERERVQDGEEMGFFVKNVENVQGDERDVIVFSTTFGRDPRGAFRRNFGALGQSGGERRLNVAVTRARQKVVLVTSMPIEDISDMLATKRAPSSPRDFLQAYLDYASKISSGDLEVARATAERLSDGSLKRGKKAPAMDGFVMAIRKAITELGYTAIGANDGDTFGIDLAIEDPRTGQFGLAIECDSPRDTEGHLRSARAREVWRPAVIRRAIPVLHRVSSYSWYHNNAEERARLVRAVDKALGPSRIA